MCRNVTTLCSFASVLVFWAANIITDNFMIGREQKLIYVEAHPRHIIHQRALSTSVLLCTVTLNMGPITHLLSFHKSDIQFLYIQLLAFKGIDQILQIVSPLY